MGLRHSSNLYRGLFVMGATQNYSTTSQNRVVAFFRDRDHAYRALSKLRDAGFDTNVMGLAVGPDAERKTSDATTNQRDVSFWQKVKDFFSGDTSTSEEHGDLRHASQDWGWSDDRYGYYEEGIASGGAVVTVVGNRIEEARRILQQNGGDLRETGFETRASQRGPATPSDEAGITDRRIQLRGEMLRTYKDRVQRGEVRLRKEVVTENRSVEVPVTHEELVVEHTAGTGQTASGDIGTGEEVRIPLSEERVRLEKQPVVTEEVRVGKRPVQDTKQISDQVRHEELRVEKEGDVNTEAAENISKRKKPAA